MIISDAEFLRHIQYLTPDGRAFVVTALRRAHEYHSGQMRDSGLPFVTHPIAVADYLARLEADPAAIAAALLHDAVEDERASFEAIEQEFGSDVRKLVDGVTKLSKLEYEGRGAERQTASLRKLLLIASDDLRVILIKLADRWHNIETISGIRPDKQIRITNETLDIYVPFARLAGLYNLKERFEEICFPIALPDESRIWHTAIADIRETISKERHEFIRTIDNDTAQHVVPKLVLATDYEVFQKLQGNISRVSDSQNLDSVVLIIDHDDPKYCYEVLGEVHMKYPVRGLLFKDYISTPQPNGYRALHTTIFLSRNHQVLLRIQTRAMYEFSTKRKMSSWATTGDTHFATVLASLSKSPSNQEQFLSDLRSNVLAGRINVFTTSGEVINLPKDATGIDFAFALNPDHVGYLGGIRLNGEMREATVVLNEGDTVEPVLFDANSPAIRAQWLEKAKSVEAREALKENLSADPRERQHRTGRILIEQECRKRALPVWWLFHLGALQTQISKAVGSASFEDVLVHVGRGTLPVHKIVDAYKNALIIAPTWTQKVLKMMNLLPRERVINKQATIVDLEIVAEDRKGLIYDITKRIAERDINISQFGVFALPPNDALYKVTLEFAKFDEFSDLYDSFLEIPNVKRVLRKS